MTFTPGPWKWERLTTLAGQVPEYTLNGPDVLCRYWYDKPLTADACLIGAAPDLLDALIQVKHDAEYSDALGDIINAAITKATVQQAADTSAFREDEGR